jgi:hypothetical protein
VLHPKAIHPAARKHSRSHLTRYAGGSWNVNRRRRTAVRESDQVDRLQAACHDHQRDRSPSADGSRFVSADDLLRAFVDTFAKRRIQPLITSVSALNVVLALDSRELRHGGRD